MLDVKKIRHDFPLLQKNMQNKPLSYFDNAATTQKPLAVIEAINHYYRNDNANVHRSVYALAERATKDYEEARKKVQRFLHAAHTEEIIWVRGATEAINLVAQSFLRPQLQAGDEILLTMMEHHSNIVPWQLAAEQTGAQIKVVPINDLGELDLDAFEKLLSDRTKIFSVTAISNTIGTINPIQDLIHRCHQKGIPVLIDAAQATPHVCIDVQALDCDFLVLSAHKCFGPTGIGVLYGKKTHLEQMPPYQGGGDMIRTVSFEKTTFNALPMKFEAGTPHIAGSIGFGAAIDYLTQFTWADIATHEKKLYQHLYETLSSVPGVRLIGTAKAHAPLLSFVMDKVHPHDIGSILDHYGIAVRAGHHCTMPLMKHFNVPATARASLAFYNTQEEIDRLPEALLAAQKLFS